MSTSQCPFKLQFSKTGSFWRPTTIIWQEMSKSDRSYSLPSSWFPKAKRRAVSSFGGTWMVLRLRIVTSMLTKWMSNQTSLLTGKVTYCFIFRRRRMTSLKKAWRLWIRRSKSVQSLRATLRRNSTKFRSKLDRVSRCPSRTKTTASLSRSWTKSGALSLPKRRKESMSDGIVAVMSSNGIYPRTNTPSFREKQLRS